MLSSTQKQIVGEKNMSIEPVTIVNTKFNELTTQDIQNLAHEIMADIEALRTQQAK